MGKGDHQGDDYYALDWNYYSPEREELDPYEDLGRLILAGISGEVIYAKEDYPECPLPICWYGNQVVIYNEEKTDSPTLYPYEGAICIQRTTSRCF